MAAELATLRPVERAPEGDAGSSEYEGRVGEFVVEVRKGEGGGSLTLTPQAGTPMTLEIQGDRLTVRWEGPTVRLEAPGADVELAGRNIRLEAEESVTVQARTEVDIHSGVDVEVRADRHVNLWGHGVLVGD